ncbi:MAG: zinc metalloprotease HtpX [Phycisphaeraceae bacterium]|nr:zinc metalloprotease HtpX [Phycisphaeraceae bacterium]
MTRFANNAKTVLLLGTLFGLILFVGAQFGQRGLLLAFIFGGLSNIVAYFFSDRIALATMRAQQVDEQTAPDLFAMVRRLAENAGLPMPKVYVCPQEAPNAFATGRNPRHAAVAVTQGALRLLSYDELEGVMAHELSHVKNRDTLISAVAATIAGALNYLGYMAFWFGGGGNNREGGHPLVGLLLLIFAPIAAVIIQLAISRSREFVADADAARLAGTPHGLIGALRKLDAMAKRIPLEGEMPSQSHMFIVQPLCATGGLTRLFATHPSTERRIARLMEAA